ncbi:UNVERIFIED_CONTAM: hypothetical protein Slati_3844300 [Sesamum latifolium]|uniref:Uncharacterized protein n=1 Tax=Sesamum latifolium TaxID=2727402 RepID=A0AAW2TLI6_9LAMI
MAPPLTGSRARTVLTSPEGDELEHALRFDFKAFSNDAEYEALIGGTKMALDAGSRNLTPYSYS